MNARIGFMQGRLSPLVDGRIQAFPAADWEREFGLARELGFGLMEWTLDHDGLRSNPLLTKAGRDRLSTLSHTHSLRVPSVTGDCFMQAPFWKDGGQDRQRLLDDWRAVVNACAEAGVLLIVVPLVDNGRLESRAHEDALVSFMSAEVSALRARGIRVCFESDYAPAELARFIERLEAGVFGVNYDIGNSAALGYAPRDEVAAYGRRIVNVHVKDRLRGGTTVPLGEGAADFEAAFSALSRAGYDGRFILQTARAMDGDHAAALRRYRDLTASWLGRYPFENHAA